MKFPSTRSPGSGRSLRGVRQEMPAGGCIWLNLRRNRNLLKNGDQVRMFMADRTPGEQLDYQEIPQEEQADVGEIYQDKHNEAAIILDHDVTSGGLLLDGTIGSQFVVKPAPVSLLPHIHQSQLDTHDYGRSGAVNSDEEPPSYNDLPEDDDEFFLDEDDDLSDEVAVRGGFPLSAADIRNGTHLAANVTAPRSRRTVRAVSTTESTGYHIIFKREVLSNVGDYVLMEQDQFGHGPSTRRRTKRRAPPVVYPEILVIVDYDTYRLQNLNNDIVKKYFISFWNGVDLRYKLLRSPKVRMSIAGIIISRARDATPYLEKNRVGRDAIDSAAALTDLGKYLFVERRLPVYDIAVAITKLDMCRRDNSYSNCHRGTAGFAYVGGACVVNKRLKKVNSVAIIEDTGGFSGIIVGAHEVGHLLGAVHDGSPPPSYLGGPGARQCLWEDGFIMSDLRHTDRGFRWSPCTKDQFHHFLNGDTAVCLYNSPHEDLSLPRILPGKVMSLDGQCGMDRGTNACFSDDRVCAQLFCYDKSSGYCVAYRPAAEGSKCGRNKFCLNGQCVSQSINEIGSNFPIRRMGFISESTQNRPVYTKAVPTITTTSTTTTTTTTTTPPPRTTSKARALALRSFWQSFKERYYNNNEDINNNNNNNNNSNNRRQNTNRWRPQTALTTTSTTTTTTTTPRTTTSPTTTTTTTTSKIADDNSRTKSFILGEFTVSDGECEDRITNIGGSLSCKEFLHRYGFQYCRHKYISKNCCASRKLLCGSQS